MTSQLEDRGIRLRRHQAGEHRAACPECERGPRDDALAVRVDHDGGATWVCHRCGLTGGIAGEDFSRRREKPGRRLPESNPEPDHGRHTTLQPWGWEVWKASEIICRGSVAADYLEHRGCALPHPFGDLRWHRNLKHRTGYVGPALVGLVTDTMTGEAISLHRTWISPTGKAEIEKPRLMLAGHRSDGVIRLWPDEEVNLGLVIGEGVETCLAAARVGLTPAWATMSAGNLASFPVLPGLEGLTILADHDRPNPKTGKRAGHEAAGAVVERYVAAGFDPKRDIRVILPPVEGQDFNDMVAA